MELVQIRQFLAVVEHAGFSSAAQACGVTQPALTAAVKRLEKSVGGELFHREGRRLVLTELGRLIKPHLEQMLTRQEAALEVARNFRLLRVTPLRVGVIPTIGPAPVAQRLTVFRRLHPGLDVGVSEAPLQALLHLLEDNELDFALASTPDGVSDSFRSEPLYEESYVVAFAPGHRFERMDQVRLGDVSGEDYVDRLACELRERVMQVCGQRGIELYARFRSDREEWVQGMVQAGLGFAFMPEHSVTLPGVLARPLVDPEVRRTVNLIEVRGRARTPAAAEFVAAAKRAGAETRAH
jgi:DNA-binding transcriptional LysR family regulator